MKYMISVVLIFMMGCSQKSDVELITETMIKRDLVAKINANGTMNPESVISVGSQISGIVKKVEKDYNDIVQKGDILVILDETINRGQLEQSIASLNAARANLNVQEQESIRFDQLYKKEFVSESEYQRVKQQTLAAKLEVERLEALVRVNTKNLENCTIRAPMDGIIISREIEAGQTVAASFQTPTLFKIANNLEKMEIQALFSEADIAFVQKEQPVEIKVDAYPDETFEGVVKSIRVNAVSQQNVVSYVVIISVSNEHKKFLPGMSTVVQLKTGEKLQAESIPLSALRIKFSNEKNVFDLQEKIKDKKIESKVWIKEGDKVIAKKVHLGINDGQYIEVLSGLTNSDEIITSKKTISSGISKR